MIIQAQDIQFSYITQKPILTNVSFAIHPGELTILLGINGSGKSTLLKCLNRIHRPSAGKILIDNNLLCSLPQREIARRIGYVPQIRNDMNVSVFETILLGRHPHSP